MSNELRRTVLNAFKTLHRTRLRVFKGDEVALSAARKQINEEYKKCKGVKEESAIKELVKYSNEVDRELRTTVIQAKEITPGKYEAQIGNEVVKVDNVPFKDCGSCSAG